MSILTYHRNYESQKTKNNNYKRLILMSYQTV